MAGLKVKVSAAVVSFTAKAFCITSGASYTVENTDGKRLANNYAEAKNNFSGLFPSPSDTPYKFKLYQNTSDTDIIKSLSAGIIAIKVSDGSKVSKITLSISSSKYRIGDLNADTTDRMKFVNSPSAGIGGELLLNGSTPTNSNPSPINVPVQNFSEGQEIPFLLDTYDPIKRADGLYQSYAAEISYQISLVDVSGNTIAYTTYSKATDSTDNQPLIIGKTLMFSPLVSAITTRTDNAIIDKNSSPIFTDTSYTNIIIVALPSNGKLYNGGTQLKSGDSVPKADIESGKLKYIFNSNQYAGAQSSFSFRKNGGGLSYAATITVTMTE